MLKTTLYALLSNLRAYQSFLEGGHTWTPTMHIKLTQDLGVDTVVAQHLSETYGDRAFEVGRNAAMTGMRWPVVGKRLNPEYPYIEAEVRKGSNTLRCVF